MSAALVGDLLEAALRLGVPILLAALGEIVAEKAGVVNVGIEGMMLAGAFASVLADRAAGSPWAGLAGGVAAGAALALVFAAVSLRGGGDPVVTGTGINLLALGATGFLYRVLYGRTGSALTVVRFAPVRVPALADLPVVGPALFAAPATTYVAFAAVVLVWWLLGRTGFGLRLRAAGEEPRAAEAAGASVLGLRTAGVVCGGALAGAGGAALALAHAGTFVEGMTAGKGFIALALVLFARWNPFGALGASVLFGLTLALQFEVQALRITLPYQFVRMIPYVATLLVLALTAGRGVRTPAALGRAYRR